MNEEPQTLEEPRYVWPWFVRAAFVLGTGLFLVWVSAEVRRTKAHRDGSQTDARPQPGPLPGERAGLRAGVKTTSVTQFNDNHLAEFRDVLHGGDAATGRKIFFDKPEANCGKCHKAGGQGGDNGPPLDGISAKQLREFILESILFPNAVILTNYETVIVLLKSGGGTSGTIKSETDTKLLLITPDIGPVTIRKADVQERMKGASPMPEGIWQSLTRDDLRNLIEFVATLK